MLLHYVTIVHFDGACATLSYQTLEHAQREFDASADNASVVYSRIFAVTDYGRDHINSFNRDWK